MKTNLTMNIDSPIDNYNIIKFEGEFDKPGHSEIKDELESFIKSFKGVSIVFDFKKLKFINSEGIGYLMEIHTHLVKNDQQLVIIELNNHVKDVFDTIGLAEIISIHEDINSFLKSK